MDVNATLTPPTSGCFWTSKTTWSGIAGIAGIVTTELAHRPDLLPVVLGIIGFVQIMFVREGMRTEADRVVAAHLATAAAPTSPETARDDRPQRLSF